MATVFNEVFKDSNWSLAGAQRAIVFGGGLAMAYTQLTTSPAITEYARALGANSLHIGILGALPTGLFFMQFLGALWVNRLRFRRWPWFWLSIAQRLMFLPAALGPLLFPDVTAGIWIYILLAHATLNHGLLHLAAPLWMSWMGDYLPREGLSRFWGARHHRQQWMAFASLTLASILFWRSGLSIQTAFALLMVLGSIVGILDVLLFLKVAEPPVTAAEHPRIRDLFLMPLRDRQFRSFIEYSCFWHFAAMVGAPFIGLYLLDHVGLSLFQVLLLWAISWVGGALVSERVGDIAERFGHRPLLVACTALKTINMLALLCTPAYASWAFWFLVPVLMMDAQLNAGINIANQGFMLKYSPVRGRAIFIANGTALAGMVGGITAIVTGYLLMRSDHWSIDIGGWKFVNFHAAFALSTLLRLVAIPLAKRVKEPESDSTRLVVRQLWSEAWPGKSKIAA